MVSWNDSRSNGIGRVFKHRWHGVMKVSCSRDGWIGDVTGHEWTHSQTVRSMGDDGGWSSSNGGNHGQKDDG